MERTTTAMNQDGIKNMVKVKTALADKYVRLARTRQSKPAKTRLERHAERFRQQAANAKRQLGE